MNDAIKYLNYDWFWLLKNEFKSNYFQDIKQKYEHEKSQNIVFPFSHLIFEAFNQTSIQNLKIILLGQDPYFNAFETQVKDIPFNLLPLNLQKENSLEQKILLPQAMGLSFSVPKILKPPPSLVNIFKELNELDFKIPTHGDLTKWAKNGILLLNSILSVKSGFAGSHKNLGWQKFTDRVIQILSHEFIDLIFILLGNFAKTKIDLINQNKHIVLCAPHPSPLSRGFIGSGIFKKVDSILKSENKNFNWNLD